MRKVFLLAIILTGSFAFANNFTPNVSSEINKETETVTQTDVLSVQSDVILDYQITETSLSPQGIKCYISICKDDGEGGIECKHYEISCETLKQIIEDLSTRVED